MRKTLDGREETRASTGDIQTKTPSHCGKDKTLQGSRCLGLLYKSMSEELCGPWRETNTDPFRYKSFWNRTLDNLSIICKRFYKTSTLQGTEHLWEAYSECRSKIRKLVNRRKRADNQENINTLEQKHCGKAIEQICRMQRLRSR